MKGNKFLSFLIISLALTAFLAGYVMVSRGLDPSPSSKTGTILDKFGEQEDVSNPSQEPKEAKPFLISDRKVTSISNSSDRKGVVYFEKNTGKLFGFNFEDKTEQTISNTILPNFLSSIWSPVKAEALSLFYSPNSTKFKYHSYDTGKTSELSNSVRSAAFSPDGSLIAYYLAGIANSSLPDRQTGEPDQAGLLTDQVGKIYISQTDGTYPKKVLDTRLADLEISWPIKDRMVLKTLNSEVFLLSEDGKLTKFIGSMHGLEMKWSLSGRKLIFSWTPDGSSHELWLKDAESKSESNLNLSVAASKCAWSIDDVNIFCAVPRSPSVDDIYQISTQDGSQKLVAELDLKIEDLFITALDDHIIFTSASDQKLYAIELLP